jgi:branched-chain amino acid transport system ATP-binding protein
VGASSGEILFRGERVTHMAAHRRVEAGIALSPEGRQVFAGLTVKENLISGTFGLPAKEVRKQIDHVYDLFPRLRERTNQRAGSLSGGEQQMLAVSRALMSRPRLMLVDELSLGLAPIIVEKLYGALRQLCERGLAVVMVEQFHLAVAGRADRQFTLDKGRFVDLEATVAKSLTNGHVASDAALMQTSGLVGHASEGRER